MTIQRQIYDTDTLLGVFRQLEPVQTFWLDLAFGGGVLTFDDEYVDFSKITETRKLAPLVVPTAQGRPIYSQAEKVFRVKPAYLKPKDAITAASMIRRKAGMGELLAAQPLSPQQRFDATLAEMARQHRDSIMRYWEKMAADAILYGSVTLEAEDYPRVVVDFERDPGHTVILTTGNRWGDVGVSILDFIEESQNTIHMAKFGGPVNRLIVGTKAWKAMAADTQIRELLRRDLNNTSNTSLNLGLGDGTQLQYKGRLSQNLEVWVYSDYYEENGVMVPFMDSRDILLIGTNVQGVRCFGAILDKGANMQPLPIYPKMWDQEDPSATFLLTQSAPLMVPVNPNNTFRARVVA